jgi:hypothetical protein
VDLKLEKGFRMPTTDEIFMGLGLTLGFNVFINWLMKDWAYSWQMPVVMLVSSVMCVFSAMKIRDGHRKAATDKVARIEVTGDWTRVHCTRDACTGEVIVKPISDVDVCFMCPICRQELRVGKSSGNKVMAYAPIEGAKSKV